MLENVYKRVSVALPSAPTPSTGRWSRSGFLSSLTNIVLYQVGWFGCVLAAAAGMPVLAVLSALAAAALHVALAPDRRRELEIILLAGLLGLMVDTVTVQAGIFHFPSQLGPSSLAPMWIVALWMQFGMTLHYCFSWLSGRYWLSSAMGAVGGPLSFLAGARLGAVEILSPVGINLVLLGLLWGVALPVLVAFADKRRPRFGEPGLYRLESSSAELGSANARLKVDYNR
jgi:hypothetical protein